MLKKTFTALLAVVMIFALGCSNGETGPSVVDIGEPVETPKPETEPADEPGDTLGLSVFAPTETGMVAAGNTHTVLLRTDGVPLCAGQSTAGQTKTAMMQSVVYVDASDELTAAVTADGKALLAGRTDGIDVSAWTDIMMIACGKAHVVGLKKDGTVVAAGDNAKQQCDVSAWSNVVSISAEGDHTVALLADGKAVACGDNASGACAVSDWTGMAAIDTGYYHTLGLKADGTVVSTAITGEGDNGQTAVTSLANIAMISAGGKYSAAVANDGTVTVIPAIEGAEIAAAASVSAGFGHVAIMGTDGLAYAYGDNSVYQCDVNGIPMRPYLSGTNLGGLTPGSTAARMKAQLSAILGGEVTINKDGAALADTDIVGTGCEVLLGGTAYGTVSITGDLNKDGLITIDDYTVLENIATGSAEMEETIKAAIVTGDRIQAHVGGAMQISQFPNVSATSVYGDKLAEAQGINGDVVGYIAINGTNIDYPVLYGEDFYYNYHDINKKESTSASSYTYYNRASQNIIVTAHNSRVSQTMFHELHHLEEFNMGKTECQYGKCSRELTALPDFKNYADRVWTVNMFGFEGKYEIFAMYELESDDGLERQLYNIWWPGTFESDSRTVIQEWIQSQIEKSEFDFGVTPSPEDQFLTVLTCATEKSMADKGGRLYYFLHRVG